MADGSAACRTPGGCFPAAGRCAAAGRTNNCNARLTELHADTGIFFSTDARTAAFPALPTRIAQTTNGYNILPTAAGQLDAKVRVTYEDVNGKATEELLPMSMFVNEEPAGGDVASPGNGGMEVPGDKPAGANIGWVFWTLGGIAVATGAVFLGIKAKKKRERALEEE